MTEPRVNKGNMPSLLMKDYWDLLPIMPLLYLCIMTKLYNAR